MAEHRRRRLLQRLLSGSKNIPFTEAVPYAEAFGFRLSRIHGSHHIRRLIERYNLTMEDGV
jgi:hypothetical protein